MVKFDVKLLNNPRVHSIKGGGGVGGHHFHDM